MDAAVGDVPDAEPPRGARRLRREEGEPDWLCDGAFLDEFGRTWLCGRIKHSGSAHQAWLFVGIDGDSEEVAVRGVDIAERILRKVGL